VAACSGLAGRLPVVTTAIPAAAISGRTTGVALVAAGAVSVQFGGAVAITLFDRVGAGGAVMLRLVVAAVILVLGTVLARVAQRWRGHRAVAARHSRADLAVAAGFGVALAAMNLSFYEAIARIPLGPAVSIELLGPLTLAAVSSRRRTDYAWVAFALAGVATLGLGENRDEPIIWPGVLFALAAGACWAAYILLSSQAGRRFARADGLAVAMVVGAVLVAPFGVAAAGSQLLASDVLWRGAAIAGLSSALPYTLELLALRRITPATFGVLMSLEPAIASVAGLVVIGQVLSGWQWLGLAAVVVACAGVTVFTPSRSPASPSGPGAGDPV